MLVHPLKEIQFLRFVEIHFFFQPDFEGSMFISCKKWCASTRIRASLYTMESQHKHSGFINDQVLIPGISLSLSRITMMVLYSSSAKSTVEHYLKLLQQVWMLCVM